MGTCQWNGTNIDDRQCESLLTLRNREPDARELISCAGEGRPKKESFNCKPSIDADRYLTDPDYRAQADRLEVLRERPQVLKGVTGHLPSTAFAKVSPEGWWASTYTMPFKLEFAMPRADLVEDILACDPEGIFFSARLPKGQKRKRLVMRVDGGRLLNDLSYYQKFKQVAQAARLALIDHYELPRDQRSELLSENFRQRPIGVNNLYHSLETLLQLDPTLGAPHDLVFPIEMRLKTAAARQILRDNPESPFVESLGYFKESPELTVLRFNIPLGAWISSPETREDNGETFASFRTDILDLYREVVGAQKGNLGVFPDSVAAVFGAFFALEGVKDIKHNSGMMAIVFDPENLDTKDPIPVLNWLGDPDSLAKISFQGQGDGALVTVEFTPHTYFSTLANYDYLRGTWTFEVNALGQIETIRGESTTSSWGQSAYVYGCEEGCLLGQVSLSVGDGEEAKDALSDAQMLTTLSGAVSGYVDAVRERRDGGVYRSNLLELMALNLQELADGQVSRTAVKRQKSYAEVFQDSHTEYYQTALAEE